MNSVTMNSGKKNSRIDTLLLCETFLTRKTANMVNIQGFTHIGNYREGHLCGVSILLNDSISYKRRKDLDVFIEGPTESVFMEIISKNFKKIILGSMYQPPNTCIDQFSTNIIAVLTKPETQRGSSLNW